MINLDFLLKHKKIIYLILWIILFIMAIFLFGIGINNEVLSGSEGFTYAITNNPVKEIARLCHYDYNPPLYFIMVKFFSIIFGNSIFSLRVFSLIGILFLMALGIGPIRRIFGDNGSIIYMLFIMILPSFSLISQDAQPFSWACFFITAGVLYGYLLIAENKLFDWVKFGLTVMASCYIHYYTMIAAWILTFFIFIYLLVMDRKKLIAFSILTLVMIIIFLSWVSVLKYQIAQVVKRYWIPKISYFTIMQSLTCQFNGKSGGFINYAGFALFIALLYYAIRISILEKNKQALLLYMSLIVYSLTFLFIFIFSKYIKPVLYPPYMQSITGILLIITTYTVSKLKSIKTSAVVLIFLAVITLPASISVRTIKANEPLNQVIIYLKLNIKEDDAILHSDDQTASVFSYYFPKNKQYVFLLSQFKGYTNYEAYKKNITVGDDVRRFLKSSKNVWIVGRNENFIPFNFYKSVFYNKDYKLVDNPEIFDDRNSWITVELFKFEKLSIKK